VTAQETKHRQRSKVPEIAIGFWIIKIAATALGWTATQLITGTLGDNHPNPSSRLLLATAAVAAIGVAALVYVQVNARKFDRWMYWLTFAIATVCATSVAVLVERSYSSPYPLGSLVLLACFLAVLFAWHRTLGAIDIEMVADANIEAFYWTSILLGQTLGFQLGDAVAAAGLGYAGAAALFGLIIAALAYGHFKTSANEVLLFWGAFVLTCPLSAALVDFLFKPLGHGGLALSPPGGSIVLLLAVLAFVYILPPRSARHAKEGRS